MCEETKSYLWATQDLLGHGATSQVYKAYNKNTGELVAAKVYQVAAHSRPAYGGHQNYGREKDFRPILDREMDILKDANHENIVRYITLEPVISSDSTSQSLGNREALLIEYCNGGSLHNVLELPENRYGLMEDEFMLLFKHLTNALKYLHDKNTIHRDIKPDNIMLSININGDRTYKLADLGVARLINDGENAFTSLVGTEEYIHPDLYRAAVPDNRTNGLRTALKTRVDFPFEVDLWSLGVTLYQCATGELPFQPFAGTRKDRTVMKHILDNKPTGCISGIEATSGGNIQWSKTLPSSCRLSPSLKRQLESLLQRLLESDRTRLMTFKEFFTATDRIFKLMPIYYLNLKRFQLNCGYFDPSQSTTQLYDELHQQNSDENNEEYYCLFQNVPYPISKTKPISIKKFCEQLPIPTSRETPLVFYTFSPINQPYSPTLRIPDMKPIRQYNDVAAACEWSRDVEGLFFYVKAQLIEYQNILQTAQCSTTIIQQHLKSRLLEFLCSIRSKLIVLHAIEELNNILDQIKQNVNIQALTMNETSTNNFNQSKNPNGQTQTNNEGVRPIGFSHILSDPQLGSSSSSSSSSAPARQQVSIELVPQALQTYLRSYLQPYEQLKKCQDEILKMTENEFGGQLGMIDSQEPFLNTLWSSDRTRSYSSWISRADKFLKDINDLNESFRKDRLLSTYNRLQTDAHFRRRKNLEKLHKEYVQFATDNCCRNLVEIFNEYNTWIQQRSTMIDNFERIQQSYEKQCEDIRNYVEMIDNLRKVVYQNIRKLGGSETISLSIEQNPSSTMVLATSVETIRSSSSENGDNDNPNKTFMTKIRGTTKKTIEQAQNGLHQLEGVIQQLRITYPKK